MKPWRHHAFVFSIVAALWLTSGLCVIQNTLTDWRSRLVPRMPTGDVVIVAVDARSIAKLGVWPWSRALHAKLLDNLRLADASDVANAVLDGTDAVMLSGETAMGRHPLLALEALTRIVREIEGSGFLSSGPQYLDHATKEGRAGATPREHAVALATVDAARFLASPAVLVLTTSGFSARLVSSHRPPVPIVAVTTDRTTYCQLSAVWGVLPVLAPENEVSYESLSAVGKRAILDAGIGAAGESIVVTAGFPFHEPGSTNMLRVESL